MDRKVFEHGHEKNMQHGQRLVRNYIQKKTNYVLTSVFIHINFLILIHVVKVKKLNFNGI